MKNNDFIFCIILIGTLMVGSCKKNTETPPDTSNNGTFRIFTTGNITTVQNLQSDTIIGIASNGQPFGSGKYTLFSLEKKTLVSNADSATTNWDLGFRGTTIIVNNGTSGPGNGGAFVWNGVFENFPTIPQDSVFKTDNGSSYAIPTGSGKGWYNYNGPANLLTPLPGKVLVIRTAKGKYAKMEILDYYKGGKTPSATASDDIKLNDQRYITFRFHYQPDGSKTF